MAAAPAPDPALRPVLDEIRATTASLPTDPADTDPAALTRTLARLARLAAYGLGLAGHHPAGPVGVEDRCPDCGGRAFTDGTEVHDTGCSVPAARLADPVRAVYATRPDRSQGSSQWHSPRFRTGSGQ